MAPGSSGKPAEYASPPCFMHELDQAEAAPTDSVVLAADVMRWRKAKREGLIAARLALPAEARAAMTRAIITGLDDIVGDVKGRTISLFWPFRGEPDLRAWLNALNERGARTALPVVIAKANPLIFRAYRSGDALEKGIWNIPIPVADLPVIPDIVIAPLVGFDPESYRLGYGGGYFDRTLASLPRKPLVIGVGYGTQRIATIYPQPHDIPMDRIVTEAGPITR